MAYEFTLSDAIISGIITLLINSLFIWVAARMVLDRSSFLAAILTALVSTFLAILVASLVPGIVGLVLGIVVWGLITALFFRTGWVKALLIGLVAWILYFLVNLLIAWLRG